MTSSAYGVYAAWDGAPPETPLAAPAPRLAEAGCRMLRGHRSQPIPAPRTTPRIATPFSRRMARRFRSRKRRCCWRLGSPNSPGVAWDKGCYMDQELTARTKYGGLVKRRLVLVAFTDPAPAPSTPVTTDCQEVGDLHSCAGEYGLAMLRLDALDKPPPAGLVAAVGSPSSSG